VLHLLRPCSSSKGKRAQQLHDDAVAIMNKKQEMDDEDAWKDCSSLCLPVFFLPLQTTLLWEGHALRLSYTPTHTLTHAHSMSPTSSCRYFAVAAASDRMCDDRRTVINW
jgi:hypothetical protein